LESRDERREEREEERVESRDETREGNFKFFRNLRMSRRENRNLKKKFRGESLGERHLPTPPLPSATLLVDFQILGCLEGTGDDDMMM
jgi:hypothetical protein